jgi:hypothetical protein
MCNLCNPHEVTVRRTETKSRLGVIIEVSSPFWPITALAISMTSGAAGLSPFADPLSPSGPASLDGKILTPLRFDAQFQIPAKQKKVVEKVVEEMGKDVDKHR